MSSITVVARQAIPIVGLHIRTTMNTAPRDCAKLWREEFGPRMSEFSSCCTGESYGASWVVDEKTGAFDYWAAVPVPEEFPIPDGMARATLPAGLYAELAVPSLAVLADAYTRIFTSWLPQQRAYILNERAPSYELYPADFLQTGALVLYFPVAARS